MAKQNNTIKEEISLEFIFNSFNSQFIAINKRLEDSEKANKAFQEGQIAHYTERLKNQQNLIDNINELKVSIVGNEMNGRRGILTDIVEIKKRQIEIDSVNDTHSEILKEHRPLVKSLVWFYGIIILATATFLFNVFLKKVDNENIGDKTPTYNSMNK